MQYNYHNSFIKDAKKLPEAIKLEIAKVVLEITTATSIADVSQIKKLSGYKNAYRIKIKDYRVGLIIEEDVLMLSRVLHRKEIYRFSLNKILAKF